MIFNYLSQEFSGVLLKISKTKMSVSIWIYEQSWKVLWIKKPNRCDVYSSLKNECIN